MHSPKHPSKVRQTNPSFAPQRGFLHLAAAVLWSCLSPLSAITPNAQEMAVATLASNHADQGRAEMVYDPILNMIARAKALDLASRGFFSHVDPDGYGPNKAAQLAGYILPDFWGTANDTNYIESLTGTHPTAQAAFDWWLGSPNHRTHVLGESAFYAGQTRYGIGYAEVPASTYTRYWVFITAPPEPGGDAPLEPDSQWLFDHWTPMGIDDGGDLEDLDGDGITRIAEFVFDFDPEQRESMPMPSHNRVSRSLEWTLSIRRDIGSLLVAVEKSGTGLSWSTDGVQIVEDTYSIPVAGATGFLRFSAAKP